MASDQPGDKPRQPAPSSEGIPTAPARFGGARADFVASMGRKINDARAVLAQLDEGRGTEREKASRDDLRRRVHALGASARLLHFDNMARALGEAEAALDRASSGEIGLVASVLDDLPALAWGEAPLKSASAAEKKTPSEPPESEPPMARTALLVGPAMLAEALTDDEIVPGAQPYECERTEDAQAAVGLARTVAPDVVVIDADVADTAELVEALLDDPMTEPVPIVVVGAFRDPKTAAKFVALGVARTLTKPITAEALRRACDEAVEQRQDVTVRVTLGEPTLEQLGERLADEVRRALVEGVDLQTRAMRVPLGEGTEVMSAVWGAIARVREVVTTRTGGAVRFASPGPEGAIAMAPWLHPDVPATDRGSVAASGRGRGPAADVRLHGRRVIVADDDPGVTWFIADLLRTAGCQVHEALDGASALELAYRVSPELVISDILMPGLDGFALTRALKRDVALRDVPVILLSWKEDLLQRVRELGASAAAYLRKESDSRAIVARVRECLRPRARVEARLRAEGEVRGRMDGLTVRSLLELACAIRPDSRVSVRDASFLYEVEIREGSPKRATRTGADGAVLRADRAIGSMLGVGAGRFTVATSTAAISAQDRDFSGSLVQLMAKPLAYARAARALTTGARTTSVERLQVDAEALAALVASTPEPARSIVRRLGEGASPRSLLVAGDVDPSLLEEVLGDLASRGAIGAVWTSAGDEVLAPAVKALLSQPAQETGPQLRRSGPPAPRTTPRPPAPESVVSSEPPQAADAMPSSLADAVMRELSDRAPELKHTSSPPPPPPIVEPSALRPRSNPPSQSQPVATPIPPDAIVPADDGVHAGDRTEIDAPVDHGAPAAACDPQMARAPAEAQEAPEVSIPIDLGSAPIAPVPGASASPEPRDSDPPSRTPFSSVKQAEASRSSRRERTPSTAKWSWLVAIGAVATVAAIALQATTPPAPLPTVAAGIPLEAPQVPASAAPSREAVTYGALPAGFAVGSGQGLLEVSVAGPAPVRVDGVARGSGPMVRVAVAAGLHEVQVAGRPNGANAEPKASRSVDVVAGRAARVDLTVAP